MSLMAIAVLVSALVHGALGLVATAADKIEDRIKPRREIERARVEAELDRTQAQLRSTMLQLAAELGADAHEARKAMIRESFLASGQLPKGN